MKNWIKQQVCKLFGFTVHSDDYNKTHYTMDWKEALEWMRCYPADDFVQVNYRGKRVAIRGV